MKFGKSNKSQESWQLQRISRLVEIRKLRYKGWIQGILGLWLIIAGFSSLGPHFHFCNNIVVGIFLAIANSCLIKEQFCENWVGTILGLWLIITAKIPILFSGIGLYLNNSVVGLIIMTEGIVASRHEKK